MSFSATSCAAFLSTQEDDAGASHFAQCEQGSEVGVRSDDDPPDISGCRQHVVVCGAVQVEIGDVNGRRGRLR